MFRSGFVAIVGRPNVGKSTLINGLVGQKIAITSHVPQTTRHRIRGVVTTEKGQLVLMDTPGFSKPLDSLGNYLVQEGFAAKEEADAFLMVVDGSVPPGKGDQWILEQLMETGKFILLAVNKVDQVKNRLVEKAANREGYDKLLSGYPAHQVLWVSAKTGKNLSGMVDTLIRKLPEGPKYYDADALTDQRFREMAAETIREKVLLHTREEIPHSVAVAMESFDESDPACVRITATLYVDQNSQKGIVVGKGGEMIKRIGIEAREDLRALLGKTVHMALTVKVKQNWRKDGAFLKSLGLAPPSN